MLVVKTRRQHNYRSFSDCNNNNNNNNNNTRESVYGGFILTK